MHWLNEAKVPEKLKAVFIYLNNGEPINAPMIGKLLKHVYRETKEVYIHISFDRFNFSRCFRMKSKHYLINLCSN